MMKEVFILGSRRYQSFGNFGFLRFFFANSCRGRSWVSRNHVRTEMRQSFVTIVTITWENIGPRYTCRAAE